MDQLNMWELPPVPAPVPEPEEPADVEEAEEWGPPPATPVEVLTEAAEEPTACPFCAREKGHDPTCPNLVTADRFVDINRLVEAGGDLVGDAEPVEGQETLFGADDDFKTSWAEWRGMPEYVSRDLAPFKSLLVHFETEDDYRAFAKLVNQKWLTRKTRSIWYPEAEWARERGVARYVDINETAHDEREEGPTT